MTPEHLYWEIRNEREEFELAIAPSTFMADDKQVHVTVSIGVASCSEKLKTSQLLIEKADAALYAVKNCGKNGVMAGIESGALDQYRDFHTPFIII